MDEKVAHEDNDQIAVAHVRDLVPAVREPVLERGVGQVGFSGLEVFGDGRGERGCGRETWKRSMGPAERSST